MQFMTGNWILLLIAFFVYVGAQAESQAVAVRAAASHGVALDVLIQEFVRVQFGTEPGNRNIAPGGPLFHRIRLGQIS
jgi:hypothetical protein